MIDQHEIDRNRILEMLEQTSDTVITKVAGDCIELLQLRYEQRMAQFKRNLGVKNGTFNER